ncbi:MAG: NAD(P)H-binding protein [Lentimicrobium sp.]
MEKTLKLTALVFGSTGLTGNFLTEFLTKDSRYERIVIFVRKEIKLYHGKIKQVVFNPEKLEEIKHEIVGDQLFCCLGSTIKKAGSKEQFFKIDHHLVINIAKAAISNEIKTYSVISSIGANPKSSNFYLNTKGLTEEVLKSLDFENLNILRPSMLLGIRSESRPLEETGKVVFKALGKLMIGKFRKYRPIHAETVARAMIVSANQNLKVNILESDKLEELGNIR